MLLRASSRPPPTPTWRTEPAATGPSRLVSLTPRLDLFLVTRCCRRHAPQTVIELLARVYLKETRLRDLSPWTLHPLSLTRVYHLLETRFCSRHATWVPRLALRIFLKAPKLLQLLPSLQEPSGAGLSEQLAAQPPGTRRLRFKRCLTGSSSTRAWAWRAQQRSAVPLL